jgi:hypothetical protein
MSETNRRQHSRHARHSIIWPVVLIVVGVVFLAYNTGRLQGDAWDVIFNLWPLLLILIGLDSLLDRSGVVWPSLLIGLGIVFLLNNFGLLALDVWQTIASLWPLLLVAIGLDIFIGHRSAWLSLLGVGVILILLAWSIHWLSGSSYTGQTRELEYDLGDATQAQVVVDSPVGTLHLSALNGSGSLLVGKVPDSNSLKTIEAYQVDGDQASLILTTQSNFSTFPGNLSQYLWDLQVTPAVPLDLGVKWGVGATNLDLTGLDLSALSTEFGVGQTTVVLPAQGSFTGKLVGAVGLLWIEVPEELGVEIIPDTAMTRFQVPEGYREVDGRYFSPNYDSADYRITLQVDLAIGNVTISER